MRYVSVTLRDPFSSGSECSTAAALCRNVDLTLSLMLVLRRFQDLPTSIFSSKSVPKLIKKHAKTIQQLNQESPNASSRARGFLELYVKLLQQALIGSRHVLLVDDIQHMNPSSIWVIQQLVKPTKGSRRPSGGWRCPVVVVASHLVSSSESRTDGSLWSGRGSPASKQLLDGKSVTLLELTPLGGDAALQILHDALQCKSVTPELAALVIREPPPPPPPTPPLPSPLAKHSPDGRQSQFS